MNIISDLNFLLQMCMYSLGSTRKHNHMIHETILASLEHYCNNKTEYNTEEEIEKRDLLFKCRELFIAQDNHTELDFNPSFLKRCIKEHFKFYNINF